ncbi:MAG: DUF3563 family protein [Pseudomonadota bacterium]|nr:DUF3563 family protein [Pseudomonadota bacterium]
MKAKNSLWDEPNLFGAWAKLTHALIFDPLRREGKPENRPTRPARARSSGIFERIDRWFWRQQQRDREAYLAGAQDIFELEERIRRLERSGGSRYY